MRKGINPKNWFNMKSSFLKKVKVYYRRQLLEWVLPDLIAFFFSKYRLTLTPLLYLHVFSIATVTNYHNLSGLSNTHLSYSSEGQKSQMGWQGCILSGAF